MKNDLENLKKSRQKGIRLEDCLSDFMSADSEKTARHDSLISTTNHLLPKSVRKIRD